MAVASLGGTLFGYDTGVIAGALLFIRDQFALSEFMQGAVVGIALFGALVGVAISGTLSDRYGRRLPIALCALFFILGSLACAFAPDVVMLMIGRGLIGVGIGIANSVTPIYLAEISPPDRRGMIISLNSVCIVAGQLASFLLDYWMIDWNHNWRWMLGFGVLPGVLLIMGIALLPQSPRWLAAKGRLKDAEVVLRRMRNPEGVAAEVELLARDAAQESQASLTDNHKPMAAEMSWKTMFKPRYRRVLLVGLLLSFYQMATGINAILYYAPIIFEKAGANTPALALLATSALGLVNTIFTLVAMQLVDRVGRRALLLAGLGGVIATLAILTGGILLGLSSIWFATLCLCGFIACFALSLGTVYYVVVGEMFPQEIRSHAMGLSTGMVCVTNLLVTIAFPVANAAWGNAGSFAFFAVIAATAFLFILRALPETKGRDLGEMRTLFGIH
ncbi:sugar porter family MFS transporter [Novosphingobium guangzhouense]|uniref:sugar porter family MFS transporter n=1 Tax=Novosphingobium guangzhouense TaxID=1850347 RepID=UPI001475DECC|nr:sugar porter family MFS transporter [Novosphingobium guangzhouense]